MMYVSNAPRQNPPTIDTIATVTRSLISFPLLFYVDFSHPFLLHDERTTSRHDSYRLHVETMLTRHPRLVTDPAVWYRHTRFQTVKDTFHPVNLLVLIQSAHLPPSPPPNTAPQKRRSHQSASHKHTPSCDRHDATCPRIPRTPPARRNSGTSHACSSHPIQIHPSGATREITVNS